MPPIHRSLANAARSIRSFAFRALSLLERIRPGHRELLPPAHLRAYYYGSVKPQQFARMCETVKTEVLSRGLLPHHRVLDIGCGIGNLPIGLLDYLHGGYDGVDIHPEAVRWCQRTITPRYPNFKFHCADISSRAYNATGRHSASAYSFPFSDQSFDFVVLGSVFTHMLPDDVAHYLREIARVLAPNGVCVASYFLINEERRSAIQAGRAFMTFNVAHPSGLYRLHDAEVPEAAVALEEGFVLRIHGDAGLAIRDIRRGGWWNGRVHDQDVITATLKSVH